MSKLKKNQSPKAVDLFSGCGGLTQGLRSAGYNVVGAIEVDRPSAEVYSKNHPLSRVKVQDISKVSPSKFMKELGLKSGELDLLAGCPPCQGFSRLRTKNGALRNLDKRNALVDQIVRFASTFRPKTLMLENVPKLADHTSFKRVLSSLRKMGYKVRYTIADAADYGVPQRRKRLILLAAKEFEPTLVKATSRKKTVKDAIGKLPRPNSGRDRLHTSDMGGRSARVMEIIKNIPKNGGSRSSLPKHLQLTCHKRRKGFNDVYGRMAWDEPSPTITGGCYNPSKGRFLHPAEHRPITLREAAILQGFPRNYYFDASQSKQAVALMIGNALPPPLVAKHAKALLNRLQSL